MKKRWLTLWLAVLLCLPMTGALALTRDEAVDLARQAIGLSDARVTESERDGGLWDVELAGENARYQVELYDADGTVFMIETETTGAARAGSFALTEVEAQAAAEKDTPNAVYGPVIADRDDGRYVYEVFYTLGEELGRLTLNAETGEVVERKVWPGLLTAGRMAVADAVALALSQADGLALTELDVGIERGQVVYEGEAQVNRREYSFEIALDTGALVEQEWDD